MTASVRPTVARNSTIYIAASLLQKLSSAILLPVYTRLLTPDEYGYFSMLVTATLLMSTIATLGLDYGVMRYCHLSEAERDDAAALRRRKVALTAVVTVLTSTGLLLAVVLLLGAPLYGDAVFPGLDFYPAVALAIVAVVFQPITLVYLSFLQTSEKPNRFVVCSVGYFLMNAAFTIAFVGPAEMGVAGTSLALLCANGVTALLCIVDAMRTGALWTRFRLSDVREILSYSLPMMPHAVSLQATAFATRLIILRVLDATAVGLFNIAMYVVNVIDAVQTAMHRAFMPFYFTEAKRAAPGWRVRIHDLIAGFVAVNVVIAAAAAIFSEEALAILTPASFHDAASIVPILALSMMVKSIYYPSLTELLFLERGTRPAMVVSTSSSVVSLAAAIPLAFMWGLTGVAVAQLVQRLMMSGLACRLALRADGAGIPWTRVLRLQVIGVLSVAFAMFLVPAVSQPFGGVWTLVLKIVFFLVISLAVLATEPFVFRLIRKKVTNESESTPKAVAGSSSNREEG
ncbi:oligosaccharide flippase family protein [Gordonia jinghuaiqii]|uniref:Lipopolysaccharide biosynthesis protein n=1 Tax=Gordonia jinghuaiqii TaxID=2758710 RepID=A0A7D7QH95_9ACTN|nr:lipopolysaccharide biosynthesis protein [Gordonia jinghuaiqii]MCR5977928.1 oligosaccharide flippase family protein [Gordonia jinghuaiqii]QMT02582.1 lipopolysaccharide biosynthesis protein [Gordonia jinghuaiqii]